MLTEGTEMDLETAEMTGVTRGTEGCPPLPHTVLICRAGGPRRKHLSSAGQESSLPRLCQGPEDKQDCWYHRLWFRSASHKAHANSGVRANRPGSLPSGQTDLIYLLC